MAGAMAVIIAPPTAWRIREPMSERKPPNNSGKTPQANEPRVNMAKPARNTFLNPIMSEIFPKTSTHPAITSRYAVATQLTVLDEIWNDSEIVGRAILTIVPSSPAMNVASDIERIRRPKPASSLLVPVISIHGY